jgi:hypothetical protein
MMAEIRHFLFSRGRIRIDDVLGACVVGWGFGLAASVFGGLILCFYTLIDKDQNFDAEVIFLLIPFAAICIPLGILITAPVVFLMNILNIVNGFSLIIVGVLSSGVLALVVGAMGGFMAWVGCAIVLIAVATAVGAWHAGAYYNNTQSKVGS